MRKPHISKSKEKGLPRIILASQSPARKRLLKRLGYSFQAIPAHLDEESYRAASPRALVQLLAREKARAIAHQYPDAIVIGSDQMLVLGRRIFGKPQTEEKACEQLAACSGKTVSLLTALTVIIPPAQKKSREVSCLDVTRMKFHKLTAQEISDYVCQDQPLECAGSFKIEKNGLRLFETIETSDASAIEGLPALELNRILRHARNA